MLFLHFWGWCDFDSCCEIECGSIHADILIQGPAVEGE